jgi:hypothetical protein
MKLEVDSSEILKSDLGVQQAFTIKATAKAFSILSSGLYSDKIWAILRELCANAQDSHIEAKKSHVPFEIHLPDHWDSHFWVEDFGMGLSHEDVLHLYTTYFESTRNKSNDFTGALGLGSKSPFSYTDCFSVTSTYEGVVRNYSAYLDETGCPNITLMSEQPAETGKVNGVKVAFVTRQGDQDSFRTKICGVLEFFDNYKIINPQPPQIWRQSYGFINTNWALRERDRVKNYSGARIIQGPIAYPLNIKNCTDPVYKVLSQLPIDIFVNIGDLDIAASREELSYTKGTIDKILVLLAEIKDVIVAELESSLTPCKTDWERVQQVVRTKFRNQVYQRVYENFSSDIFKGGFRFASGELKVNLNSYDFLTVRGITSQERKFVSYTKNNSKATIKINTNSEVLFIYNDVKVNGEQILKDFLKTKRGTMIYFASPSGLWTWEEIKTPKPTIENPKAVVVTRKRVALGTPDDSYKQFEEFIDACGNPEFIKLSSILAGVPKAVVVREKINAYLFNKHGYGTADRWKEKQDFDIAVPKYYVEMSYFRPIKLGASSSDDTYTMDQFVEHRKLLIDLGLITSDTEIYGIPRSTMKKSIEKDPNWIPFFPAMKDKAIKTFEPLEQDWHLAILVSNVEDFYKNYAQDKSLENMVPCAFKTYLETIKTHLKVKAPKHNWNTVLRFYDYQFKPSVHKDLKTPQFVKLYPLFYCNINSYNTTDTYRNLTHYVNLIEAENEVKRAEEEITKMFKIPVIPADGVNSTLTV